MTDAIINISKIAAPSVIIATSAYVTVRNDILEGIVFLVIATILYIIMMAAEHEIYQYDNRFS